MRDTGAPPLYDSDKCRRTDTVAVGDDKGGLLFFDLSVSRRHSAQPETLLRPCGLAQCVTNHDACPYRLLQRMLAYRRYTH